MNKHDTAAFMSLTKSLTRNSDRPASDYATRDDWMTDLLEVLGGDKLPDYDESNLRRIFAKLSRDDMSYLLGCIQEAMEKNRKVK